MSKNSSQLFTQEELNLLYSCDFESVYKRAVPLSMLFGAAFYVACKKEYLPTYPTLGVFPMVAFGSILGFDIGKHSYDTVCQERFFSMPESQHGAFYRELVKLKQGEAIIVITGSNRIITVTK